MNQQVFAKSQKPLMNSTNLPNEDEISLAQLVAKFRSAATVVWAQRQTIVRLTMLCSAIGVFVALGSGKEYTASMRLVPYKGGSGGVSSLSSLAGLAGIRVPVGGTDQTITVDLYPEVARSLDFRMVVAETPLKFSSIDRTITSVEYFRTIRKPPLTELLASYTIGLPGRVLSLVSTSVDTGQESLVDSEDTLKIPGYGTKYLGEVNSLADRFTVSVDKKTSIITISAKMPDPYAAADLVRIVADRLKERIVENESLKANQQFQFIDDQYRQTKVRFERAQRDLAVFADRNRALMSATSKIDQERLQREYDLSFEIYQQLSRELEQARIKMNQDTPVFTVLEQVMVPSRRSEPQRGRILLIAGLLGLLGGIGVVAGRHFMVTLETSTE